MWKRKSKKTMSAKMKNKMMTVSMRKKVERIRITKYMMNESFEISVSMLKEGMISLN